jgi:glycerol transport system ATP-binding protein
LSQNKVHISGLATSLSVPENLLHAISNGSANNTIKLGIRPEFVECHATSTANALPAQLTMVRNMGTHWLASCQLGEHKVSAKLRHEPGKVGSPIWLSFPSERSLFYVNDKRVR